MSLDFVLLETGEVVGNRFLSRNSLTGERGLVLQLNLTLAEASESASDLVSDCFGYDTQPLFELLNSRRLVEVRFDTAERRRELAFQLATHRFADQVPALRATALELLDSADEVERRENDCF